MGSFRVAQRCGRVWFFVLVHLLAVVAVALTSSAWAAGVADRSATASAPPSLDGVYNCPADLKPGAGSAVEVGQIIQSTYHRWREIRTTAPNGGPGLCIEMVRPQPHFLTIDEARAHLAASNDWLRQQSVPASGQNSSRIGTVQAADDPVLAVRPRPLPRLHEASQPLQSGLVVTPRAAPILYSAVSNTSVFPWNTIGYVLETDTDGQSFRCSGFLVAPRTVLTAGHCIYNLTLKTFARSISFAPAQYTSGFSLIRPFGIITGGSLATNPGYIGSDPQANSQFDNDFGVFFLPAAVTGITTFMPIVYGEALSPSSGCLNFAGYPSRVNGTDTLAMEQACGAILQDFGATVEVNAQVIPGNSGGPAWLADPVTGSRRLEGVVTFGADNNSFGGVTHFTAASEALIEQWVLQGTDVQSGWWWNPAESGRGYSLEVTGGKVFFASYLYNPDGTALWFVATGPMATGNSFSGPLYMFGNGQTLDGSYVSPIGLASPGNLALTFTTPTTGTINWPGGVETIQRFDITAGGVAAGPDPGMPERGWWWNPAESGRGFFIEVQKNSMFFSGYLYDSRGNPSWYISTNTMTSPTLFTGDLWEFGNGQFIGSPYRVPTLVADHGAITIQFSSRTTGILTLPDGKRVPIQRYTF